MSTLTLSELTRLTPPFANAEDEEEAFRYWSKQTAEAKLQATTRLTREHYRELGIDVDKPRERTLVRRTVPRATKEGDR